MRAFVISVITGILLVSVFGSAFAADQVIIADDEGLGFTGIGIFSLNDALSDNGNVVFHAFFKDRGGDNVGIFKQIENSEENILVVKKGDIIDGYTLTDLRVETSINDNGDVVYSDLVESGGELSNVIFKQDSLQQNSVIAQPGDIVGDKTIRFASGDPMINNNGDVIFLAFFEDSSSGIVKQNSLHQNTLIVANGADIDGKTVNRFDAVSMNNNGDVVFRGTFPGGTGIFINEQDSDATILLAKTGDTIGDVTTLANVINPWINDNGDLAFVGLISNDEHVVVKQNSLQENTILAETGGIIDGRTLTSLAFAKSVLINNNGDVIFFALYTGDVGGTLGYFTPDDYLIGNGDIIDGKTVAAVTTSSINNHVGLTGAQFTDNSLALIKFSILSDVDGDGVDGIIDNCPETANPSQEDSNENGVGDACDADTLRIAELESALTDAEDARDAALDDLNDLFTLNSCDSPNGTIFDVLACIDKLINDLTQALTDLDTANARIAELEALLGEEDVFTEDECMKFQELADKREDDGKSVPKGIAQNVQTCVELGHLLSP